MPLDSYLDVTGAIVRCDISIYACTYSLFVPATVRSRGPALHVLYISYQVHESTAVRWYSFQRAVFAIVLRLKRAQAEI